MSGVVGRLRATPLGTKLAILGALLAGCVVGGAFLILRLSIAAQVRREFTDELHSSQQALRSVDDNNRRRMLENAQMIADGPTLRAAVEAWRNGATALSAQRVATLDHEVRHAFADGLDADLLLITDDSGMVITSAGRASVIDPGRSLQTLPAVSSALYNDSAPADSAFGVLVGNGVVYQVAAVPMLIDGFAVGALVLGKRVDRLLPPDADRTRRVVSSDHEVIASTLPAVQSGDPWNLTFSVANAEPTSLRVRGEEFAFATLALGRGVDGAPVELHLLRSIDDALGPIERDLTLRCFLAAIAAVLLVGLGGTVVSRSALAPLSRFVDFMQSSAGTEYGRFVEPDAPREIQALTESYNRLIESLQSGHEELRQRTIDLAKVNHRLNRQIYRRERAEQALRDSEEQLRQAQKLEALGALAGGVAHDFNNILSIILGYADIVQSELPSDSAQRADVKKINDAAMRARALVKQLLAFSRKQVLQPQVLNLNHVMNDVTTLLHPLMGPDIAIDMKLAADLAPVKADPVQIEQVLLNLAVNARDAMPHGGRLTIETANVTLDGQSEHHPLPGGPVVMLSVTDTGIGMDVDTRRRIFEPFFTTKPVGKGTGLGLATVYGIVRQSDGNITVYSEPGAGATFRCYFPCAAADTAEISLPAATPARENTSAGRILLVDDDDALRELLTRSFQQHGYQITTARNGDEALEAAAQHDDVGVLVTDMQMPGISGGDLAEQMLVRRPGLKVVILSGYSTQAIERHGVITPDCVFLQKPVSADALLRAVSDLLREDRVAIEAT